MANNDGFILYGSFLSAIEDLPEDIQGKALLAICRYGIRDEEPTCGGIVSAIFKMAKPQIDANRKRRENGKLGGRKPSAPVEDQETEPTVPESETKTEPTVPKNETILKPHLAKNETETEPKEKEKEKVKVKGKVKAKEKDNDLSLARPEAGRPSEADLVKEFEELWKLYPRKEGHDAAKKAYVTARKSKALPTTMEEVRDGLLAYCRKVESEKTERRYIMQGSTFFRGRRWTDDFTISARDRPPAGRSSAAEEMQDYYDMTARWAGGGGG